MHQGYFSAHPASTWMRSKWRIGYGIVEFCALAHARMQVTHCCCRAGCLRRRALLRRHRRSQLPVDASAFDTAADCPFAAHTAQAVLALSRGKAVAAEQAIALIRILVVARAPVPGFIQCGRRFAQAGGAILLCLAADAGCAVLLVACASIRQVRACGCGDTDEQHRSGCACPNTQRRTRPLTDTGPIAINW